MQSSKQYTITCERQLAIRVGNFRLIKSPQWRLLWQVPSPLPVPSNSPSLHSTLLQNSMPLDAEAARHSYNYDTGTAHSVLHCTVTL